MLVIGLTGGIGAGKSTVAHRFEAHGTPVIDADHIARELLNTNQTAYRQLIDLFGKSIILPNGSIDRSALRQLIFCDEKKRTQLEGILHPLVRKKMRERVETLDSTYCILMVPLLIESGQMDMVDRILLVRSNQELQVQRAALRDSVTPNSIEKIIATQADPKTREAVADDILDNNEDLASLYAKIDTLHQHYVDIINNLKLPTELTEDDQAEMMETALTETIAQQTIYELPLNERIRTLMRLEGLFLEFDQHASGDNIWHSRAAIKTLLALQNALNRPDIKTELIQELDRLHGVLNKHNPMPQINSANLALARDKLANMSKKLRSHTGQFGQDLKQNALIIAIKQRQTIPGGPSTFDIPCYGFWLNKCVEQRQTALLSWIKEFELLREATTLILHIVRASATPTKNLAKNGTFQLTLEAGPTYQLIRVILDIDSDNCAEISGGRQRFGIRFIKPHGDRRAEPAKESVSFLLSCCAI